MVIIVIAYHFDRELHHLLQHNKVQEHLILDHGDTRHSIIAIMYLLAYELMPRTMSQSVYTRKGHFVHTHTYTWETNL